MKLKRLDELKKGRFQLTYILHRSKQCKNLWIYSRRNNGTKTVASALTRNRSGIIILKRREFMKKNIEIKNCGNDVIVTDGKSEYFRKPKTKQTIAIANEIYFAVKYGDRLCEELSLRK
ncbi:MAG: hypothetical protein NC548_59945 [Lachnospiraceae bacterium]|nr:hypothetical protein [Lachnospiraceae bacterium]